MRITANIATPLFKKLKNIQNKEGGSPGELVIRLLAGALKARHSHATDTRLEWVSKPMRARTDIVDKEAVYALLGEDSPRATGPTPPPVR